MRNRSKYIGVKWQRVGMKWLRKMVGIVLLAFPIFATAGVRDTPIFATAGVRDTVPSRAPLSLSYRITGVGGTIMKDGKVDEWLGRAVIGGEFAVEFQPTGRWYSLQEWNNSSVGVGATFLNLGNDAMLGNAIAVHGHLTTPFFRTKHFAMGIRPTVGLAFCTKYYANTFQGAADDLYKYVRDPQTHALIANWSIGSVVNAYLAMDLWIDIPIARGFDITLNGGWHHISNGSAKQPNCGYNMLLASIGLRYQPDKDSVWVRSKESRHGYREPQRVRPKVMQEVEKKWDVELSATGGIKQNYYRDNYPNQQFYGVATVQVAAHWIPTSVFKIGAGVDGFYNGYYKCMYVDLAPAGYNGSITHFGKTYLATGDTKNCFRVGLSLQPEFIIGNLTAGIHIGFYVWDPIKNLELYGDVEKAGGSLDRGIFYSYDPENQDGWCYLQFVLKYRVLKHLFVQAGLKTHGTRAEFFDAGLGVAF